MSRATAPVARYVTAGTFLEALAAKDFAGLAVTLADGAQLQALVPRGLLEWDGPEQICQAFTGWFGDTEEWELLEGVVGDVGARLYLRWRLRVRAQHRGDGWFIVEQQVYADTDDDGQISLLRLLCSGFCPEVSGT